MLNCVNGTQKGAQTIMRARIINICQYEYNPRTKENLHFDEANISRALDHKTIKEAAYIRHDKDKYTEEEEQLCIESLSLEYARLEHPSDITKDQYIAQNQWVHAGEDKPPHWHIVARCANAMDIAVFAAWFGVPEHMIDVPKGRGAFYDCVEYLTHENPKEVAAGKHRYEDSEVHANFDYRTELDRRALSRAKYGQEVDRRTALRLAVLNGEMTLRDVRREYPVSYTADRDALMKFRLEYIQDATPPLVRHNYYVCGGGGIGKGAASVLLAKALYPDIEDERDLFFRVGASGTTYDGYDGQPVIIWDDCRSYDLLKKLGSRGNVFNVFDTTPQRQRQNVKFGSLNLINTVNIVNSVQPYEDFLNGLVGEYTDSDGIRHTAEEDEKAQSYRRFPFIMPLRAEDFDILINRAYMEGEGYYADYIKYERLRGNFGKLMRLNPGAVSIENISTGMVRPLIEARDQVEQQRLTEGTVTEEDFAGWGEPIRGETEAEAEAEGSGIPWDEAPEEWREAIREQALRQGKELDEEGRIIP